MFDEKRLNKLQSLIGYGFKDISLLKTALTHSSFTNECKNKKISDYERLEFIGDAILEMVTSLKLYREFPAEPEGRLSKMRAALVCEEALSAIATNILEIPQCIVMGRGEEQTGGRHKPSILCDVVESIIGAIYLDGGIEPATVFIESIVLSGELNKPELRDPKTALQELVQSKGTVLIQYKILDETGPDHNRVFTAAVYIGGKEAGQGRGHSKKQAQQEAAAAALKNLK